MAEITQLFDTNIDPQAKQKILSGQFNVASCPSCGYQGNIATPLVYHDAGKELLLTFFPAELGLPVNEQEKLIGPLISMAVNKLPAEKRKAYIFRPQTMLTMKLLVEKVLEGEGITREMIEKQEKQLAFIRELMNTAEADMPAKITTSAELIDETFFELFSHLTESALASQDKASVEKLGVIEKMLLEHTEIGQKMKHQALEAQEAVKSLQEISKSGMTRENLLDLIIAAPNEIRLSTLVRMTRSGMDYSFFQILTERIEAAGGDEKQKLTNLRNSVLKLVDEIDRELQAQATQMDQLIDKIVAAPDIARVMEQLMPAVNEIFVQVLRARLEAVEKSGDQIKLGKLNQIVDAIQKAATPPPEYGLIEQLLQTEDDEAINQL
ncbi:MAG: hypothetical protein C0391_05110, partial [Anaerolinea sp.]|nr:hypothetical protein [Anaerolinea sp.]